MDFYIWARTLENYVATVYDDIRPSLAWTVEQDPQKTPQQIAANDTDFTARPVSEINEQPYTALSSLTEGESFDIVYGSGAGNGYEAWRRLLEPYTAGRAGRLLKDILSLGRVKLADINGAIEKLEDLLRRFTSRKDATDRQLILADDVRMASLEALLPSDLEKDSRRTCCYVKKSCSTARQEAWCMKDLEDITRLPWKLTASGRKEHKGQRQQGRCWQAVE